ncbi:thiosulfate oxidation carrier complex protein SoxZ [sulfur-oxidizing endosymbiont of Gigantopelta aegis]|uniref:thiosulfate oxidation carrier complex protein SoxZ n=1 Tax=sulfur-oxidizing endosymbiont of Gigantopelta aegis TaxID=2794934 RepID=UPI0018DB9257|nr:thiosulfate oxidation carrier complex protein SoxZ [sulfur-oxidizing endosymbiont of Gigantopelta aegis]
MRKSSIKIRAQFNNGTILVKALISHPMETGLRINKKTGQPIPAKFIKNVKCVSNKKVLLNTHWGVAVSKNPYLSFRYSGGRTGDIIKLTWTDNTNQTDSIEAKVK